MCDVIFYPFVHAGQSRTMICSH